MNIYLQSRLVTGATIDISLLPALHSHVAKRTYISEYKVTTLTTALKGCFQDFGIASHYIDAWALADTHFGDGETPAMSSPVLVTLNCAPGYCTSDEVRDVHATKRK